MADTKDEIIRGWLLNASISIGESYIELGKIHPSNPNEKARLRDINRKIKNAHNLLSQIINQK